MNWTIFTRFNSYLQLECAIVSFFSHGKMEGTFGLLLHSSKKLREIKKRNLYIF